MELVVPKINISAEKDCLKVDILSCLIDLCLLDNYLDSLGQHSDTLLGEINLLEEFYKLATKMEEYPQ